MRTSVLLKWNYLSKYSTFLYLLTYLFLCLILETSIKKTRGKLQEFPCHNKQHCVKSVPIWNFFWTVFSRILTRKNSVFGHFSHSVIFANICWNDSFLILIKRDSSRLLFPAAIYLLQFNNENIRIICEIYSKLTMKISGLILVSKLLTMTDFTYCSGVSIVDFGQVNAGFRRKERTYP